MSDTSEHDANVAPPALSGLVPTRVIDGESDPTHPLPALIAQGVRNTVPIVLAGSMAMSLGLGPHLEQAATKRATKAPPASSEMAAVVQDAVTAATTVPPARASDSTDKTTVTLSTATLSPAAALSPADQVTPAVYRVAAGDTVSSIAGRYGLSTASVLALNGLGWKSVIFPGQVLKLTKSTSASTMTASPAALTPASTTSRYLIVRGDTLSAIASRFGVTTQAILTANALSWSSIIYPGQSLVIPGASGITPTAQVNPVVSIAPARPASSATSYVIRSGDTLSAIAQKFGVSIQSILTANGLGWSSVIYAGHTIAIPAAQPAGSNISLASYVQPGVTQLTPQMAANAAVIVRVGRNLGVSNYGIIIALSAAMQESSLLNVPYGDRDSVGLFQQRPSTGWGTASQLLDPSYAARLFFGGPQNPNAGTTRGLLDITGWQSMSVAQAAQKVQRSAHPNAYAQWESSARAWLSTIG